MADLFNDSGCDFSPCRTWRYTLFRRWDQDKPYCMFIGLNPSTADEERNDPTVRRCIRFAHDWGYGALYMMNLFAVRTPDPAVMKRQPDPVGPKNNQWLKAISLDAGLIVAAWGTHGTFMDRAANVMRFLPDLHCLKVTKDGHPQHPLYIAADTKPQPYKGTQ